MSDPLNINGPGLPAPILHALVPRRIPVEAPQPSHRIQPPPASGAEFSSTGEDVGRGSDAQLLSDLRSLAELHRIHQAARAVQAGGSSNES
jgi:hypothetical protein